MMNKVAFRGLSYIPEVGLHFYQPECVLQGVPLLVARTSKGVVAPAVPAFHLRTGSECCTHRHIVPTTEIVPARHYCTGRLCGTVRGQTLPTFVGQLRRTAGSGRGHTRAFKWNHTTPSPDTLHAMHV